MTSENIYKSTSSIPSFSFIAGNKSDSETNLLISKMYFCLKTRRNQALDYSIKSRPVSALRGTPVGWSSNSFDHRDETKLLQSQIFFLEPGGPNSSKKGLSGFKLCNGSAATRSSRPMYSSSFVSDPGLEPVIQPTLRPLSHKLSNKLLSSAAADGESVLLACYKWNRSSQGLRWQRELTRINSIRATKIASEMTSYRINPGYCLCGRSISLQDRLGASNGDKERPYNRIPARILRSNSRATGNKLVVKSKSEVMNMSSIQENELRFTRSGANFPRAEHKEAHHVLETEKMVFVTEYTNKHAENLDSEMVPVVKTMNMQTKTKNENLKASIEEREIMPGTNSNALCFDVDTSAVQYTTENSDIKPLV